MFEKPKCSRKYDFFVSNRESMLFLSPGKIEKVKEDWDIKKNHLSAFHVPYHTTYQCIPC